MKKLLLEYTPDKTRLALTEDGKLQELIIDKTELSLVGHIFVGRIRTIMPGQFAFIDIGRGKNAFANLKQDNQYKTGQPILVQVQKDATSTKGAYVSTDISLKGFSVILHQQPPGEIGVSHKITHEKEVRRLKKIVRSFLPKGYGAIVRTNAQGLSEAVLGDEINMLYAQYQDILERAPYLLPPSKLYPKSAGQNLLRDVLQETLEAIYIEGTEADFAQTQGDILSLVPSLANRIHHHTEGKLFAPLTKQIHNALEKVVPLPCGGFITIEATEAFVAVDVNTGNNTQANSYRQTILNTNVEAAKEIMNQIILRNLSGLIVVDFIDMAKQEDKATLMHALTQAATRDRLNPEIAPISKFGLVQIARPKRRLPLSHFMEVNCPHCHGKGKVKGTPKTLRDKLRRK